MGTFGPEPSKARDDKAAGSSEGVPLRKPGGSDMRLVAILTSGWMHFWQKPFFRFLFIGGINTIFGFGTYSLLILMGVNFKWAIFISMIVNVMFNFITIGRVVFKNSNNFLILKFIGVYALVYFANVLGVGFFLKMGLNSIVGGALCVLPVAVLSFFLNKIFVFKNQTQT